MKKLVVCLMVLISLTSHAVAVSHSGNGWHAICNKMGLEGKKYCALYIEGFADGIVTQSLTAKTKLPFCLSNDVTVSYMADVFAKHLDKHPEQHHLGAPLIAYEAFSKAFPCKQ